MGKIGFFVNGKGLPVKEVKVVSHEENGVVVKLHGDTFGFIKKEAIEESQKTISDFQVGSTVKVFTEYRHYRSRAKRQPEHEQGMRVLYLKYIGKNGKVHFIDEPEEDVVQKHEEKARKRDPIIDYVWGMIQKMCYDSDHFFVFEESAVPGDEAGFTEWCKDRMKHLGDECNYCEFKNGMSGNLKTEKNAVYNYFFQ